MKWDVMADAGRLTVQRAKSATEWQGEMLGELTYWDAADADHSLALSPARSHPPSLFVSVTAPGRVEPWK